MVKDEHKWSDEESLALVDCLVEIFDKPGYLKPRRMGGPRDGNWSDETWKELDDLLKEKHGMNFSDTRISNKHELVNVQSARLMNEE